MDLDPIVPQPGSDRDPAHFVGRVATTTRARERLTAGANLLLTDPRRMGKTFWMRTFAATEPSFRAYLIDYQGVGTVKDFITKTAETLARDKGLPARVRTLLSKIFDHVESFGVSGALTIKTSHPPVSPHLLLVNILNTLNETDEKTVPLVMMDEVPMAIDNIARHENKQAARELLQTLRSLRQGSVRVRWIITGSIGFHHVLHSIGATSGDLADLEPLHLGPMPDGEARELAQRLLIGIGQMPADPVVSEFISVGGGVPSILQKVASILRQRKRGVLNPQDVRECFEDIIDDRDEFLFLKHLGERIDPYYGARAGLARKVLGAAVSMNRDWIKITESLPDEGAATIIDDLCSDHYLERRGHYIRWRYPAFQYIWARSHDLWERP